MSAQSTALAPTRTGTFGRQASASTRLVIGSVAVAGAIAVAAAGWGISRSPAAPQAERGGTGHTSPVTSPIERAVESGAATRSGAGAAMAILPSAVVVQSAITGLDARVPAAESPMEQVLASQATTTATARAVRVPPADAPLERAAESRLDATAPAATVLITDANGFVHRLPLR